MKSLFSLLLTLILLTALPPSKAQHGELPYLQLIMTWRKDLHLTRNTGALSPDEATQASQAILAYARTAEIAWMKLHHFARQSLAPLRQQHPEKAGRAIQEFETALTQLFINDMQRLRQTSLLTPEAHRPQLPTEDDPFTAAMQKRINQSHGNNRALMAELQEHLNKRHQQRVEFVADQLAGDRPDTEFLTNTPLEEAPTGYADTCKAAFLAAYTAWQHYADSAAQLHCPVPAHQGNGTPAEIAQAKLMLRGHFEQFLTRLVSGFAH